MVFKCNFCEPFMISSRCSGNDIGHTYYHIYIHSPTRLEGTRKVRKCLWCLSVISVNHL